LTLGGGRRALLKTTPPAKPGEASKDKSYMLTEGERQDDLEVVAIDEQAATVKVSYAGVETTLNFKDNGVASTTPAAPGAPGAKPGPPPPPGPAPAFRAPTIPPRPVRANGPPAAPQPDAPPAAANSSVGAAGLASAQPAAAITAEQQALLIEMNREQSKDDPTMPPFPPTLLTEELNNLQAEPDPATAVPGASAAPTTSSPTLPMQIPGRPPNLPSF
jgi:hypothetical protein